MILRPQHSYPHKSYLGYILLPFGYIYNAEYANAKKGDKINFRDGYIVTVDSVVVLDIKAPITDVLCRMCYGIPIKVAQQIWANNVVLSGNKRSAISKEQCLMINYDTTAD